MRKKSIISSVVNFRPPQNAAVKNTAGKVVRVKLLNFFREDGVEKNRAQFEDGSEIVIESRAVLSPCDAN